MKNRLLYLGVAVLTLLVGFAASRVEAGTDQPRVHQHLVSPWQQEEDAGAFVTHLPIVEIETGGQRIPGRPLQEMRGVWRYELSEAGEKTIPATVTLRDGGEGRNTLRTRAEFTTGARLRLRGNSSRHFPKKSYAVSFVDGEGGEKPLEALGMAAHNEWALGGPFLDRTLLRNYLCLNTAGEIMDYAPNVRYCEVFLDGEYRGVYLLMETVARGKGRVDLTRPVENRDMTGWLVRWDRTGKGDRELENYTAYTYKSDVSALDVRYPGKDLITSGRMNYICGEISEIERTLYSGDLSDSSLGYRKYLDSRAFAQYFVINEFYRNVDAGRFSTFYYKDVRGKVEPVVWDFNNACDNYADYVWDEAGFTMQYAPWIESLLRDPDFVEEVVAEYRRLRGGVLSESYQLKYIDATVAYLGNAVGRNYGVWGAAFERENAGGDGYLHPADRNAASYAGAVAQLRDFIVRRGRWLDAHIETLYQYCADSRNANQLVY